MEYRKGRLGAEEIEYIEKYHDQLSIKEMADVLKRRELSIEKYVRATYGGAFQKRAKDAEYNIRQSIVWKDLERQFSPDELKTFLFHWGKIISQFKDDVFPTEQMQVIDTIKYEILMNRALTQQQECREQIGRLQIDLEEARANEEKHKATGLERQIGILRASQESMSSSYLDMSKKKDAILKEMKATRDARIQNIESSKESFGSWMRKVMSDATMREDLGKYIEKMRLASDSEVKRLSEMTEYIDGTVDQPFLNEDTVTDD